MGQPKVFIMSFKVKLYSLEKRDNSTKQPASDSGHEFDCILKAGSGIIHPTLSFDIGVASDPSQYNYAYIPVFDRYYFIEEWYFERALWTCTLKVDVLATYKTEIGNSNLYVMRAAAEHDGSIIDTLYPAKAGCSFDSDTVSNPWWNNMVFIIGVVSKAGTMGSLSYYGVTSNIMNDICAHLIDNTVTEDNGFSWDDCSQALQLSLVDPLQYIKSCIAIPVSFSDISNIGTMQRIYAFNWDTGSSGYKIARAPYIDKTFTFDIKKHPDTNSRGNYVNSAPYTNITLTLPPFGTIDIDTSVTCNASTLSARVRIDPITGKAILSIQCNGITMNRVEAQLGVPVSLSSVTRDYIGAASSALGAAGGMIESGLSGSAGGFIGSLSGVGNAVGSLMPRSNTIGTSGGFASALGTFRLDHQFFRPIADDNAHNGRPLMAKRTLKNLSGYMIIQDGDVPINGTSSEDQMVRNYLESGFYYE